MIPQYTVMWVWVGWGGDVKAGVRTEWVGLGLNDWGWDIMAGVGY